MSQLPAPFAVDICVVGGLNMDLVVRAAHLPRPGETAPGRNFARFLGGKGANQAVAAARLGASVRMVGQVGEDAFGDELLAGLENEGIDAAGVRRVSTQSGVAVIVVDDDGQNSIVWVPGANAAWEQAAAADVERWASRCRTLVLPLEAPRHIVEAAVRAARKAGVRVILNPAPFRQGDEACFGNVDVLVPNELEAALFAGVDPQERQDWTVVASRLQSLGPKTVVITLGSEGALAASDEGTQHVPAFPVEAVDTTAAGDAFVAALAVALLPGPPLPEAVRFASAAGALAVTSAGAQPSLPRASEVEALMASSHPVT
jgi:ribokinase